jgi:TonB family protein
MFLAHLACAVYWFHPLIWMVAAQLRREQEQACDDAVLLSGFAPASYAEALIAAAQNLTSTRLTGCHMITRKTFRARVARLLNNGAPRVSSAATLRRSAIGFAAAVVAIGLLNAQDPKVYRVGGGVSAPRVISRVDPQYTPDAKDEKVAGRVLLSIVVGTDGLAHDIRVVKSLDIRLDGKAIEAVQKWHFAPGVKGGEAVAVRAQIEINFRLL